MEKYQNTIVDSHHHFWDLSLQKNKWLLEEMGEDHLGDISNLRHPYVAADFLEDSKNFNISKSVHIQAGWDRDDHLGESQWLLKLSEQSGFPNAIVAYADLSDLLVETKLAQLSSIPNVRGIRQILSWHKDPFYRGCDKDHLKIDEWRKNFGLLEKYGLSFDMQIYPEQIDDVIPIISCFPEINIVIDHALMPIKRDKEYLLYWREQLKKISIFPNVKIKISGIAMFDHLWGLASFSEIVLPVIEIFSASRCMVGSNFPVDKLYGSYGAIMSAYVKIISQYSKDEQADIFSNAAKKFYRL
jgi:predicted TIM-barrel fold metal-dependent hydrolase